MARESEGASPTTPTTDVGAGIDTNSYLGELFGYPLESPLTCEVNNWRE